ncbi:TPA: hypothetical protein JBC98_15655 [Legionella pneumophila subsp. pneumophila]|nr:hypothetical protein [Legionella pneumophila subsp. pneumophila]
MALFVLDFDETITSKNTHNAVSHLANGKIEDIWSIIKEIVPRGGTEIWRNTIRSILQQGHSLAIASFNAYGLIVIPMYLREVIGLSEEEVSLIHIESWLPLNLCTADKSEHIKFAIKEMGYKGATNTIVLVDDDPKNIIAAKKNGYRTIHAIGSYIEQIQQLSKRLSNTPASKSYFASFFYKSDSDSDTSDPDPKCTIM